MSVSGMTREFTEGCVATAHAIRSDLCSNNPVAASICAATTSGTVTPYIARKPGGSTLVQVLNAVTLHTISQLEPVLVATRLQIREIYMQASFRVVIFSGGDPAHIHRLAIRIMNEVPEAQVCGILCERRPGKTLSKRVRDFLRNVKRREFIEYAASKVVRTLTAKVSEAGTPLLHFVHGGSPKPVAVADPIEDLKRSEEHTFELKSHSFILY